MRTYSVFDDLTREAIDILEHAGIAVTLHPGGVPRPSGETLRRLMEEFDILLISTAETITEDMLSGVRTRKIIGTVSSGTDHIHIPADKADLVRVVNAPTANAASVAEHTFALILALSKHLTEAREVAALGESKRCMRARPEELRGQTLGVIGAGNTATAIMRLGKMLGMRTLCWTRNPGKHAALEAEGVRLATIEELLSEADIISLNLPLTPETRGMISAREIGKMKENAVFVSTSRAETTDIAALLDRARRKPAFSVGLDIDAHAARGLWDTTMPNVIITPHIAGGTAGARARMFAEVCRGIVNDELL